VLDAPDAVALSDFYRRLLGWTVDTAEPNWVKISGPDGGAALSFQTERLTSGRGGRRVPTTSR
jgi:hypothetical protein